MSASESIPNEDPDATLQAAALELDRVRIAEMRAHRLAEVRKEQGLTQRQLASVLGISQERVSQIERNGIEGTVLSTLAAYVGALGGRLRVVADFGE